MEYLPPCELCLLVLKELENILPTERTKDLILKELNRICSVVPEKYSEKCKELVKDEGAMIIDMILNQLGPNAICFGLKLCFVDSSAELTDELGRPTCDICEKNGEPSLPWSEEWHRHDENLQLMVRGNLPLV